MDDQYQPFGSDWTRQYYDPSHPLYVSSAAEDGLARLSCDQAPNDLGPWGRRAVYTGSALVLVYFALIFVFGTH